MTVEPVRVSPDWLALRERADAAARDADLAEQVRRQLPDGETVFVHDLGCGTGSMGRWLAPRIGCRQHWVLYDWDSDLLVRASDALPRSGADGAEVTSQTRRRDVSRLDPDDLTGASLITASALLDLMTADELTRCVEACAAAGCPVLITLSVTGNVELDPWDPLDELVRDAFNAHQRRTAGGRTLLGPDAVEAAVEAFTRVGFDVQVRPSPWRLGAAEAALAGDWFSGWMAAACEQRPELAVTAEPYALRRLADAAAGRLGVTVDHVDLLAVPR
jgi:trans-aconitate methyltransferase